MQFLCRYSSELKGKKEGKEASKVNEPAVQVQQPKSQQRDKQIAADNFNNEDTQKADNEIENE